MDYTKTKELTAEDLAEGIKAVYQAYKQMIRNMTKEEVKAFDKDLKEIIGDKNIY